MEPMVEVDCREDAGGTGCRWLGGEQMRQRGMLQAGPGTRYIPCTTSETAKSDEVGGMPDLVARPA